MAGTYDWNLAQKLNASDIPFDVLIFTAILRADSKNMEKLLIGFPELVTEANAHYHGVNNDDIAAVKHVAAKHEYRPLGEWCDKCQVKTPRFIDGSCRYCAA